MYLKYGNYQHDSNECTFTVTKDAKYTESGLPYELVERWDITGELYASTVAGLTAKILALEAAYNVGGRDIALYQDDGTITAAKMLSGDTLSGTQVIRPPSYPDGSGADYATYRRYAISVQGIYPANVSGLIAYRESVTIQGTGAATWGYTPILNGPPVQQQLTGGSTVITTQEGYATALNAYPVANGPLLSSEHHEQRVVRQEVPAKSSRQRTVSWRYVFETLSVPGVYPYAR